MESICAALAAGDEAMTGLIGDARFDAVVTEVECEQLIGIFPDGFTRVAITGFNDGCDDAWRPIDESQAFAWR